jgi:putative flippase GtrA
MKSLLTRAKLESLARFALGGVLSSGISIGTTALLHEVGSVSPRIAAAVGLALALLVNFVVLRYFVFKGGSPRPLARQLVMFLGSSGVFRALEYVGFLILSSWLKLHYMVAMLATLAVSFVLKFLFYEMWVFRRRSDSKTADAN